MSDLFVNQQIKILIKKLGVTPYRFAKDIGTSPTVIYNIIGRRFSDPSKLIAPICKKYNVNANWLIGGIGEVFMSDSPSPEAPPPKEK